MNLQPVRFALCGTTFGRTYLAGADVSEQFELAAILARGSARSRSLAAARGVRLVGSPDEIGDDVGLAVVAVRSGALGGSGTDIALSLLRRGTSVLVEQPMHARDIAACIAAAGAGGSAFALGDLYRRLPAVARFIDLLRDAPADSTPRFVEASAASQLSFPLVHIMFDALRRPARWTFHRHGHSSEVFVTLDGTAGDIGLGIRLHNEVVANEPDNHMYLLFRITAYTDAGSLTLMSPNGPVIWTPRLHVPDAVRTGFDFADPTAQILDLAVAESDWARPATTWRDMLEREYPRAAAAELADIAGRIDAAGRGRTDAAQAQRWLTVAQVWHQLTAQARFPAERPQFGTPPAAAGDALRSFGSRSSR